MLILNELYNKATLVANCIMPKQFSGIPSGYQLSFEVSAFFSFIRLFYMFFLYQTLVEPPKLTRRIDGGGKMR